MNVILMSGISGSGKNTYINERFKNAHGEVGGLLNGEVCSADDFFETAEGYKFDPRKLPDAHGACLRKFVDYCAESFNGGPNGWSLPDNLIVNNTNLSTEELAPYVAIAQAYKHNIELVTIHCPPHIAAERSLHVNSLPVLKNMHDRLMARKLPPFWNLKLTNVPSE